MERYKVDRYASSEICTNKGAENGSARVFKSLVDRKSLSGITTIQTRARTLVYTKSLPWLDSGVRVLPNSLYMEFMTEYRSLQDEHEKAVEEFLRNYNSELANASRRLGELFDWSDYPTESDLRSRFAMNLSVMPMPESDDFRVENIDVDALKAEFERQADARVQQMISDMAKRIVEIADEYTAKVTSGKRFWDSLPKKLAELGELLDGLNVIKNQQIATCADKLKNIGQHTANVIRASESIKAETLRQSKEVRDIASKLADIF